MRKSISKKRPGTNTRTRLDHIDPDGTVWFASVPSSEEEAKQMALIKVLSGDNLLGVNAFTGKI
jgi:hypothetical protein